MSKKVIALAILSIAIVVAAVLFAVFREQGNSLEWLEHPKVFTAAELKQYDGTDPSKPLYLVVLGEVYDVTEGERHYKKGAGYNIFLGQDSSRSFHSGDWEKPIADVTDLPPAAVLSVVGWRTFYREHKKYRPVGVLEGVYFTADGKPTKLLRTVEALRDEGVESEKYEEKLTKELPGCNMQSVKGTQGMKISCLSLSGKQRYPRIVHWTHSGTKKETKRCACLTKPQVDGDEALPGGMKPEMYKGCSKYESTCQPSK